MKRIAYSLLLLILFSGCSTATSDVLQSPADRYNVRPYISLTPSPSQTPPGPGTATPLPSPSPTPRSYAIRRGDTFSDIAFNYGISIESLRTANPDVDPSFLIVGTVLAIPQVESMAYGTPIIPSPTPVSLDMGDPVCHRSTEGGVWCFVEVTNNQSFGVENLIAAILLEDRESGEVLRQEAVCPLNLLRPGNMLPLVAYFPPPTPTFFEIRIELITAMPLPENDSRYLPLTIQDQNVTIANNDLSAQVTGSVVPADASISPSLIWVVAVAYDPENHIVGVRRWESNDQNTHFRFSVYSSGSAINHVVLQAEARP